MRTAEAVPVPTAIAQAPWPIPYHWQERLTAAAMVSPYYLDEGAWEALDCDDDLVAPDPAAAIAAMVEALRWLAGEADLVLEMMSAVAANEGSAIQDAAIALTRHTQEELDALARSWGLVKAPAIAPFTVAGIQ